MLNHVSMAVQCKFHQCVNQTTAYKPWKSGHINHAVIPPWLVNCPSATSKIRMGTPANTRQMKYGMRKQPWRKESKEGLEDGKREKEDL